MPILGLNGRPIGVGNLFHGLGPPLTAPAGGISTPTPRRPQEPLQKPNLPGTPQTPPATPPASRPSLLGELDSRLQELRQFLGQGIFGSTAPSSIRIPDPLARPTPVGPPMALPTGPQAPNTPLVDRQNPSGGSLLNLGGATALGSTPKPSTTSGPLGGGLF